MCVCLIACLSLVVDWGIGWVMILMMMMVMMMVMIMVIVLMMMVVVIIMMVMNKVTGEDWSKVLLTLSTAKPSRGKTLPP